MKHLITILILFTAGLASAHQKTIDQSINDLADQVVYDLEMQDLYDIRLLTDFWYEGSLEDCEKLSQGEAFSALVDNYRLPLEEYQTFYYELFEDRTYYVCSESEFYNAGHYAEGSKNKTSFISTDGKVRFQIQYTYID